MLIVYGHKLGAQAHETISKMMEAVGVKDFKVVDLMSEHYDSTNLDPCVAIGRIAGRIVKNSIHVFPDFKEFTGDLTPEKTELRKQVLAALQNVAGQISSVSAPQPVLTRSEVNQKVFEKPHTLEEFKRMWNSSERKLSYILINSGDRSICIYNGSKPTVDSDIFYTVAEFAALLDLMEHFGARSILIYREGDKEGHEI